MGSVGGGDAGTLLDITIFCGSKENLPIKANSKVAYERID
jgi:hypothetical protein